VNIVVNDKQLYLYDQNKNMPIIGVDEAGRGPLAGPVVASAAFLKLYSDELLSVDDSKKLTEKKREKLFDIINTHFEVGVGISTVEEIDEINILNATFLAMRRALEELSKKINYDISKYLVLVDGNFIIRKYEGLQEAVIKGDGTSLSIAAASVIAKVTRDRIMKNEDNKYPVYGFKNHMGYGTKEHIRAIITNGPCEIHRKSFLNNIINKNPRLF
jgi:ribonuclease HII